MSGTARFARAVLMVRSGGPALERAVEFYHSAIGLQVIRVSDEWAELSCGNGMRLSLQAMPTEPHLSTGYSPILHFQIDDMTATITKCIELGAHMDGPIQYPAHGKVASVRAPDGHMIGLYEPVRDNGNNSGE